MTATALVDWDDVTGWGGRVHVSTSGVPDRHEHSSGGES